MKRKGFFAYHYDISAPGSGFQLYGTVHKIALGLGLAAICVYTLSALPKNKKQQRAMMQKTAGAIAGLEAARQASFVVVQKKYWPGHLPLHLCGMMVFIEAAHALRESRTTAEIIYALGLPGALAAMLFPDWTNHPIANFYPLHSFVIHTMHLALGVMMLATGQIRPSPRNLWRAAAFLAAAAPPLYRLNKRLGTNFLFINEGSPGSPLQPLIKKFGSPGFIIPYAGILAGVWVLMYIPFVFKK